MAEYIKREALITKFKKMELGEHGLVERLFADGVYAVIAAFPAADVAPVVRCKDCVHWDDDPDTYGTDCGPKGKCMKSFETMCADDFCSYGEKKDEVNES